MAQPIRYELIDPLEIPDAYKFIVNYFYAYEPLTRAYINGKEPAQENLQFIAAYLNQHEVCIKAVDGEEIVGISMGYLTEERDAGVIEEVVERTTDQKWADTLSFVLHVHRQADVRGKFGVSCPYEILLVAVRPDYRGRSIAKQLVLKQMELAKSKGFEAVYIDCSSKYTAKIVEKLNFTLVNEIPFAEYRNSKGEQVFEPEDDVHTVMRSYCKKI